jgi:hypothetical protein
MSNDVAYKMINDVITHTECVVLVWSEGELDYMGRNPDQIWETVTQCDEIQIELCTVNPDTQKLIPVDWAYLVHGNAPDETISDCLHGKWIDNWCNVTDFGSKPYVVEIEQ